MLPTVLILEVRRLLDAGGMSHRAIARKVGVSRGTVADMAHHRRGNHGQDPEERKMPGIRARTIPVRCPDCGGLVYAPCRLCDAREYRERILQFRREESEPSRGPRRAA
ncbi:helix-turn-helix domain-containing protein [Lacipirellula sp.]|uniref:helix-turn-helix domain-containing protein n=1 Tax=Lacipirellula sp. TaxID=2691419 RepID=UPI003D098BD6